MASPETINPQAGSGGVNVSCDGRLYNTGGSTFLTYRNASTGTIALTDSTGLIVKVENDMGRTCARSAFTFDTSIIPAGSTITAAVFSVYGTSKSGTTESIGVAVTSFSPAATNTFASGDYAQFGTTKLSDEISGSNWSTSGYNAFTLTAGGISGITIGEGGRAKIGLRETNYDIAGITPGFANASLSGTFADSASNKPKLVITYTGGGVSKQILLLARRRRK